MRKTIIFISIFFTLLFLWTHKINAATSYYNISVSGTISSTKVSFSGFSPPSSLIYITEHESILGTTISNSLGNFNYSIVNINPGIHEYSIYFESQNGQHSNPLDIFDNIQIHLNNIISNINLSPTISLIKKSQGAYVSGYAFPNSNLELFVNGVQKYLVNVSKTGYWSDTILYSNLIPGKYNISALDITQSGVISNLSISIGFSILIVKNSTNHAPVHHDVIISNIHNTHSNNNIIKKNPPIIINHTKILPNILKNTPILNKLLSTSKNKKIKSFVINTVKAGVLIVSLYSILFILIFLI